MSEKSSPDKFSPADYIPKDLSINFPINKSRIILLGSCIFDSWIEPIRRENPCVITEHLVTGGGLPSPPEHPLSEYALQIISLPLRTAILPADLRTSYNNPAEAQQAFSECCERISQMFHAMTAWAKEVPAFVMNYMVPQSNLLGRFTSRYDLRNSIYFFEELNRHLAKLIENTNNVYLLDINQISSNIGKFYIQEDVLCSSNHGGVLNDWDASTDQSRLIREQYLPTKYFHSRGDEFLRACWQEVVAMHRTLVNADTVKMVCVDLDDTLWRGIQAESEFVDVMTVEGWPLGLAEALQSLKRRGIILAIVSKNDEGKIESIWNDLFRGSLLLEDFAIKKNKLEI